jgi:uncharacterized protein YyaL (SSP411 family)
MGKKKQAEQEDPDKVIKRMKDEARLGESQQHETRAEKQQRLLAHVRQLGREGSVDPDVLAQRYGLKLSTLEKTTASYQDLKALERLAKQLRDKALETGLASKGKRTKPTRASATGHSGRYRAGPEAN